MPLDDGDWIEDEEVDASRFVNVGAQASGPPVEPLPPEVEQPPETTEPHRATAVTASNGDASESEEPTLPEFDPRWRNEFEGLLFLGALTKEFEWMGHRFTIKTLSTEELLEVSLLVKEWQNSLGEVKAYQAAMVSACLVKVDGKSMPQPLSRDPGDSPVRNRMNLVLRWFPTTLDAVYEQYLTLENNVAEVMDAMGKVGGSSLSVSTPG